MAGRVTWLAAVLFALVLSCKASEDGAGPQVGSNSNWLRACDVPTDCSAENIPECACGVCTVACESDQDCAAIDDARCALEASAAARTTCAAGPSMPDAAQSITMGICLPRCEPGGCGEDQACVNGACVLAVLPDNDFCNALPASTEALRALEDQLLALAEARRTAADTACLGQPLSLPQPALRLSPSLMCAARVLAADIAASRTPSVLDSKSRGTQQRQQLAGYTPLSWADGYALEATSPEHALSLMTRDIAVCLQLADVDFVDIGVGVVADAYVITLGTPL